MTNFLRLAVPLLWLLMPVQSLGWGTEGHKIVCQIGFGELTPAVKAEVLRLMKLDHEYSAFADSCVWADEVVGTTHPETKNWHFINLRRGDVTVNPGECPKFGGCILSAIKLHSAMLANTRLPDAQRLEALKYLSHWIGDLHQPLHISYASDRGGNYIPVLWRGFHETNLHRLWDSGMIQDEEYDEHIRWKKLAARLASAITLAERAAWRQGSILDWANQSFAITRAPETGYVSAQPDHILNLGKRYEQQELPVVNRQLEKAGVRLAALLNRLLGPQTASTLKSCPNNPACSIPRHSASRYRRPW